jgi:hypothetical protein
LGSILSNAVALLRIYNPEGVMGLSCDHRMTSHHILSVASESPDIHFIRCHHSPSPYTLLYRANIAAAVKSLARRMRYRSQAEIWQYCPKGISVALASHSSPIAGLSPECLILETSTLRLSPEVLVADTTPTIARPWVPSTRQAIPCPSELS